MLIYINNMGNTGIFADDFNLSSGNSVFRGTYAPPVSIPKYQWSCLLHGKTISPHDNLGAHHVQVNNLHLIRSFIKFIITQLLVFVYYRYAIWRVTCCSSNSPAIFLLQAMQHLSCYYRRVKWFFSDSLLLANGPISWWGYFTIERSNFCNNGH